MDTTSYQNKLEICILNFKKKGRYEIAFLNTTYETNKNKMISTFSYDECCKEIMFKLMYLTKCILSECKNHQQVWKSNGVSD